ncbi:hypothetical protein ACFW6Q_05265 [Streptomyces sp. NPDC058737]|uniref:hypothetical protein n=1 Tax=Streptomyces sp. NPDC058737 TaxID=3346617 RepID=UPI0036922689
MGASAGRLPQAGARLARLARRNASFRTCAGHTRSPEFVAALDELPAQVPDERTAVMCGKAAGWRRHRLAQDDEAPASGRS